MRDPVAFFLSNIQPLEDGCWVWTGSGHTKNGYGRFRIRGKTVLVHRFAYEFWIGPIADGMTIDHVKAWGCTHRDCVNPDHLEQVTNRENAMRGDTLAAKHAATTHCPAGHPYTAENTYYNPACGGRVCKTCRREKGREWMRAKRARSRR